MVVSPVNATFFTLGLEASGLPASVPNPLTMLSTPSGSRSPTSSANIRIVVGVCSAGLSTTQLPAASAGANFQAAISSGKFQGIIWATTPRGSLKWYATMFSSSSPMLPSCARIAPAKYRKWSTAKGTSAPIVSRTPLPLHQVSATANASVLASSRSAILLRMIERSVGDVRAQRSLAAWAASRATSMSAAVERGILV